jgi:hypothetical protein
VALDKKLQRLERTTPCIRAVIIHESKFESLRFLCVDQFGVSLEKDALRVSVNLSQCELVGSVVACPDDWTASVGVDIVLCKGWGIVHHNCS